MEENTSTCKFKQFDVVSDDPEDHYFLASSTSRRDNGGDCFTNAHSAVYAKIMKEWRILQKNLPESIFVRVSETRINLLRAAIVGAAGTPYHDGLFFFDISFPRDYPNKPPKVHYRSFGYRLNPNLYNNGRVCLSLLNTWQGQPSERWNPKQSTVLQVLLSLQSLVLNEKPFFNEPGMWRPSESENSSLNYDRRAFVLTCKSTLHLIRNPPKNFEPLVYSHFRERANTILAACEEYVSGRVRVGFHGCDGSGSSMGKVSALFQIKMELLYPKMVREFRLIGAPLEKSVEHLSLEPLEPKKKEAKGKPKRDGVLKKLMGKIKDVLGLKKKNGGKK